MARQYYVCRMSYIAVLTVIIMTFTSAGCSQQKERPLPSSSAGDKVLEVTSVISVIADDEQLRQLIPGHGVPPGQPASFDVVFSESGRGVAYAAQKENKFYVVYANITGKNIKGGLYDAVGQVVLSPDGMRVAYPALRDKEWRMVVDGREGRVYDVLLTPIFSPDGQHVMYQAKKGNKWFIVVDGRQNEGTMASYTTPEFSSDSTRIAFVEAAASNIEMKLIVSDLKFTKQNVKWSIGDELFVTNRDKTRIAAYQVVDNKIRILDFKFSEPEVVNEGPLYDLIEKLTFSDDGNSIVYCALKDGKRLIVFDNREEIFPKGHVPQLPVVRPDKKGVGVILEWQGRYFMHQAFIKTKEKPRMYDEAGDLVYSNDSSSYAYVARKGDEWFVVLNGEEGPTFDRVVTPLFSPDGRYLIYRAREAGRRFVVIADAKTGKTIRQSQSYEMVFPVTFTDDGKSIAYGVKDGQKLVWKVERLD